MSLTVNCPIFKNTVYSTLLSNIITVNNSGYTIAIVAIHSVDIARDSHMSYIIQIVICCKHAHSISHMKMLSEQWHKS